MKVINNHSSLLIPHSCLRDIQQLMGLNAEAPFGVFQTIINGEAGVVLEVGAVHGLYEKMDEIKIFKKFRLRSVLRENQF